MTNAFVLATLFACALLLAPPMSRAEDERGSDAMGELECRVGDRSPWWQGLFHRSAELDCEFQPPAGTKVRYEATSRRMGFLWKVNVGDELDLRVYRVQKEQNGAGNSDQLEGSYQGMEAAIAAGRGLARYALRHESGRFLLEPQERGGNEFGVSWGLDRLTLKRVAD